MTPRPPSRALARFRRHRLALVGTAVLAGLILFAAAGPAIARYDPLAIDILHRFAPPLAGPHLLGTDPLGRDLNVRLMMAGRVSLTVGLVSMLLSTGFGIVVGAAAGFYGPPASTILMRVVDAMLCFPTIFLLLTVAAFLQAGLVTITLVIAATAWMDVARLMEAQIRALRARDFAEAARANGASSLRILRVELLPNALPPIVVAATLQVARAILAESYISFLGYGIQPPTPTWGNMLKDAQQYLDTAPTLAMLPGIAITLAVTSFNFIGDGLRDALDPRMERG